MHRCAGSSRRRNSDRNEKSGRKPVDTISSSTTTLRPPQHGPCRDLEATFGVREMRDAEFGLDLDLPEATSAAKALAEFAARSEFIVTAAAKSLRGIGAAQQPDGLRTRHFAARSRDRSACPPRNGPRQEQRRSSRHIWSERRPGHPACRRRSGRAPSPRRSPASRCGRPDWGEPCA